MRNQTLKNASTILHVIARNPHITRKGLAETLEKIKFPISKDSLNNLLADLQELMWIERRISNEDGEVEYRIGLSLGMIYQDALNIEKEEAREIMARLKSLTGDTE